MMIPNLKSGSINALVEVELVLLNMLTSEFIRVCTCLCSLVNFNKGNGFHTPLKMLSSFTTILKSISEINHFTVYAKGVLTSDLEFTKSEYFTVKCDF